MTGQEKHDWLSDNSPRPLDPRQFDIAIAHMKKLSGIAAKNQLELLLMAKRRLFGNDSKKKE